MLNYWKTNGHVIENAQKNLLGSVGTLLEHDPVNNKHSLHQ